MTVTFILNHKILLQQFINSVATSTANLLDASDSDSDDDSEDDDDSQNEKGKLVSWRKTKRFH